MKIASFTDYPTTPSSRFRIRQYFPRLIESGIYVHDYYRRFSTETAASADGSKRIRESIPLMAKAVMHESANIFFRLYESIDSNRYDAVWLSRQLIIGYPSFESMIRKPLIYDIDDAIFLNGKASYYQFRKVAERARAVIAGNNFLAEKASKYSRNVYVVPTAVDTRRWMPSVNTKEDNTQCGYNAFRVGWSGTSSSFQFFLPLQREIKKFFHDFPSATLIVMSDRFPHELHDLKSHIEFVKWNPDDEVSFVQSLDVGLMPMKDDLWSKGKCAYKMLLYAACGIPVIVTPTGANMSILAEAKVGFGPRRQGEWYEWMRLLFYDRQLGRELGENGVRLVKDRYSIDVCAPKIVEIFRRCV